MLLDKLLQNTVLNIISKEEAKQLKLAEKEAKKRKTICKHLMLLPNPAENEVTQEKEPILLPVPKRRKVSNAESVKKNYIQA